ncbi:MAG: ROK family glucokinase [Lachnospiraceae bacterium]|nr:ROK family glucokinase [Lachnospiraceae bacterium]
MEKVAIGVDVGGTSIKMGLFTEGGKLLEKWSLPTNKDNEGKQILPDIAESILGKMKTWNLDKSQVDGVGIGLPGPVDKKGVIHKAVNLYWHNVFNVSETLSGLLGGMKVIAGNDANVAALGEAWVGSGKGHENIVMVTLGTGIGGGIIEDGHIITGSTGAAGEIGHMIVEENEEETCNCGNKGCMEQYGSATGIVRLLERELRANPNEASVMRTRPHTAKDLWDAVIEGDALSKRVAEKFGNYLGTGLASIATVLNPELIIIGGGMSLAGDVLLSYIIKSFESHVFHASRGTKFVRAILGNDGGIYGAARLALQG